MSRMFASETLKKVGQKAEVAGWVQSRRDMGKIIFFDLRDRTGLLQVVCLSKNKELFKTAEDLRPEFVVRARGEIKKRDPKTVNPNLETGAIEMLADKLEILNPAKTPPFELDKDSREVNEELRLKYRYLDLRTPRMTHNLLFRSRVNKFLRDYLAEQGFLEVETAILTKGTPEGAREFIVPSRLQAGKFYVLPQSPQQFKQLLMVAGLERYFQIARCFRDEDQRGDRQPEFTQLDLEMSFVSEEDVINLVEEMLVALVGELNKDKSAEALPWRISQAPFPRLTHKEAMEKHKLDKPDLRADKDNPRELAFLWVVDFPLFEYSDIEKKLVSAHHPFTSPKAEDEDKLKNQPEAVRAWAYDLALNGYEVGGGSIRIHSRDLQSKVFELLGLGAEEIQSRFGHLLEAFEYGAPPHGGIALGLDRLISIFAGEPNIREVIAFPKTGDARDPLMGAPSELPDKALKEAHIKIIK